MKRYEVPLPKRIAIVAKLTEERLPIVNSVQNSHVVQRSSVYTKIGKRAIDVVLSSVALVVALPVNAYIGVVTFFDVGRPILFKQTRVGLNGKEFELIKFRNMRNAFDANGELLPASLRVTEFGKFVRKTSLDELLNFWSILKGDMSIIGPRPLVPEYVERYSDRHKMRLAVRPGLECPPHDITQSVDSWFDQFENDVWYVENISLATDLKLFINLARIAIDKKSTEVRGTATKGPFIGYSEDGLSTITYDDIPDYYLEMFNDDGTPNQNYRDEAIVNRSEAI